VRLSFPSENPPTSRERDGVNVDRRMIARLAIIWWKPLSVSGTRRHACQRAWTLPCFNEHAHLIKGCCGKLPFHEGRHYKRRTTGSIVCVILTTVSPVHFVNVLPPALFSKHSFFPLRSFMMAGRARSWRATSHELPGCPIWFC